MAQIFLAKISVHGHFNVYLLPLDENGCDPRVMGAGTLELLEL